MNPRWRKNPRKVHLADERMTPPGVVRADPNARAAEELIELRGRVGRLEVDVRRLADEIDRHTHGSAA